MPRRFGQHFLIRRSILEQIAEAACLHPDWTVVEIGPGKGALTEHLLPRCSRLFALEIDQVLVHYLQQKFRARDQFHVIHSDVLKVDLGQWGPVAVVGNLPYYITSPIIEQVLALGTLLLNAVFLVQKEIAERMAAPPGSSQYGYLSVRCQIASRPELLLTVPPDAFRPPPKVDSAVVRLSNRETPLVADATAFLQFASACFRQKRKTLRNNLSSMYDREILSRQPEAQLRAEQLSVEQLADLWRRLESRLPGS